MIIKSGGTLDISSSVSASIINNGIIIVQEGGKITSSDVTLNGGENDPVSSK